MINVYSSPGDPLFYLHHTYLDKVWWDWQNLNLSARLTDISGTNRGILEGNGTVHELPGNGTGPEFGGCPGFFVGPFPPQTSSTPSVQSVQSDGDPGDITTLGHVLTLFGMLPNVTIADVMDTQGGLLCYEYV